MKIVPVGWVVLLTLIGSQGAGVPHLLVGHAGADGGSTLAFAHYVVPATIGPSFDYGYVAGETSIGADPVTNDAMFQMTLKTVRVHWDDAQDPPVDTWTDVTPVWTSVETLDPILWTDPATGRTIVAQAMTVAGDLAVTDSEGEQWIPTEPPLVPPSWDHETVGGGPYPAGFPLGGLAYPNAVYYCAQAGFVVAQCARSDDGGLTWGAPTPLVNTTDGCETVHGHLVVAPDGTAVVPFRGCDDSNLLGGVVIGANRQALRVSVDAGTTWVTRIVPGTVESHGDPAVAADADGRLYFASTSGQRALVATSTDRGATWSPLVDVGAAVGVVNAELPMAVAGDGGRAAVAFYGSATPGDDQSAAYDGVWHLYVAVTYDSGATWETADLTPSDPVQRGCILLVGSDCENRNLYDFQGMTIDGGGRILVGYADGCTSAACVGSSGTPADSIDSRGTIARQTGGAGLRT